MTEIECMCLRIEILEGVVARLYISQFLEETDTDEEAYKTYYFCKRCGRPWTQEMIDGRLLLKRMETEFNV